MEEREWISIKDRLPDSKKHWVVVYAPNGLYDDDCDMPTMHVLMWYKCNFGDFHDETMEKITKWFELPEV